MNLRDAKDQIEREHPELTGTAKIQAIKALRDQDKPAKATKDDQAAPAAKDDAPEPISVAEAWAGLALVVIGMRIIAWPIWGSPTAGPPWYASSTSYSSSPPSPPSHPPTGAANGG